MIELRLLGSVRVIGGDGADVDSLLRQPKRLALLGYLAAPEPGTWHRRDMLLALFWPEFDTAHARTSLRNALYVIRQALGDGVIRTRGDDEISIDPGELRSDLAIVWQSIRAGRIEEALAAYRGDLMPGLFPPDSDGFQRWLDAERMRLRIAMTAAATQRLSELEKAGKHAEALALARQVAVVQPDDETVTRRVMSLHELLGDRAGALAVFESYRIRLAADFDAEPAPETVAIADRLRVSSRPRVRRAAHLNQPDSAEVTLVPEHDKADEDSRPSRGRTATVSVALGAIATIGLVVLVAWVTTRPARPQAIGSSAPVTSDEGLQVQVAISPNGRLVAYSKGHPSKLRIFIQKIGGGHAWPLTGDTLGFESMPRWAPDNDQLLFLSRANAYVAPSIGGTPRIVARGVAGDGMVRSASWSPRGDSIVIVRNDSLIVHSLRGSGARFVGRGAQIHSCVWSPTAPWIACVEGNAVALEPGPLFGNEAPSSVVLFPAAGGGPIDVTGRNFQHRSPSWSRDGRFLWMISDRDGAAGEVFAVQVRDDGRLSGGFTRAGLRAESIDLAGGGIAYSVPFRRANIWSVPVPGRDVTTLSGARPVTSGTQLIELVRASADGRWLVYDSNVNGNADIFRLPSTGGEAERLTDDPSPEYAGTLSPDGTEMAWHRWVKGQRHIFVKHLETGVEQEIMPMPGDQGVPAWSPDGRSIAAWSHEKEEGAVFVVRRESGSTWATPAWRLEGAQLPVWSPDGQSLALVRYDGGIDVIPADSGARRPVYRRRPGTSDPVTSNIVWNLDPSILWFVGSDQRGRSGIWSVPLSGGAPQLRVSLDDPAGRLPGPMLSGDGRNFYFTLDERFSNVRVAELINRQARR